MNFRVCTPPKNLASVSHPRQESLIKPKMSSLRLWVNRIALSYIFSHLEIEDLKNARLVCQIWKNELQRASYWGRAMVKVDILNIDRIIEWAVLNSFKNIRLNISHMQVEHIEQLISTIQTRNLKRMSVEDQCTWECLQQSNTCKPSFLDASGQTLNELDLFF